MRKILAVVIMVMMTCAGASYADIVYTTSAGTLGLITIRSSVSADFYGTQYSGVGSDSLLGSYWDGSNSRVILVSRTTDTTTSGDTALTFDPSDLTKPIDSEPEILAGVYHTNSIGNSYNGKSVFFASGASIHEFRTDGFASVRSYTYEPASSDTYVPEIESLLVSTGTIYALLDREDAEDYMLLFDGQMRDDVTDNFSRITLSDDISCISWLSNGRIAMGHSDGVDRLGSRGSYRLVSTDSPVEALCQDAGDGFYFIEQDDSAAALRHWKSDDTVTELFSAAAGSSALQLLRDDNYNVLAAVMAGEILLYNMNTDSLIGEYSSSRLGGSPVNIATTTVKGDDGKVSSGCSLSGLGAVTLLLAGACLFSKRR